MSLDQWAGPKLTKPVVVDEDLEVLPAARPDLPGLQPGVNPWHGLSRTVHEESWPWKICVEEVGGGEGDHGDEGREWCGRRFRTGFPLLFDRCREHHDPTQPGHMVSDSSTWSRQPSRGGL